MAAKKNREHEKAKFKIKLKSFVQSLFSYVSTDDRQWTMKGFIDVYKNIFTLSTDTKLVSKILEIHLLPKVLEFARQNDFHVVLTDHQNYYPDFSFVSQKDNSLKFAVDLKTTYRLPGNPEFCNGFTLGSHGNYFINRTAKKNIQFPYNDYSGHFCLGIIYSRKNNASIHETEMLTFDKLHSIASVIGDFQFFVCEKWEIASDGQGSGNTANIGSIVRIDDILAGNGVFSKLGEKWFDDYWMNYSHINVKTSDGKPKKITKLSEFLIYKGQDVSLITPCVRSRKTKAQSEHE